MEVLMSDIVWSVIFVCDTFALNRVRNRLTLCAIAWNLY